jgi:hypothetical protein
MRGNPVSEFIPDELYFDLMEKGFLNERAIRDYYLKKQFNTLRSHHTPQQIFSLLHQEFPYICEDTIRKIIYTRNGMDQLLRSVMAVQSPYGRKFLEKRVG